MLKKIKVFIYRFLLRFVRTIYTYKVKNRIRKKRELGDKINVAFLVTENQKWNASVLYNKLKSTDIFEPTILLSKVEFHTQEQYENNFRFFSENGYKIERAFDFQSNKGLEIAKYDVDVLFVQQPGAFIKNQNLLDLVTTSLVCYFPYGLMVANNNKKHYDQPFNDILWKYFCVNEAIKNLYLEENKYAKNEQLVVSGHPKVDDYFAKKKNSIIRSDKKTIIYAPHHSLETSNSLQYATFDWNGLEILEFAEKNEQFEFIFKPHPRLKYALIENKVMSEEEVKSYYTKWDSLDNAKINDSGDYWDDFEKSDIMITDCGSFIAEYYLTGKRLVLLINPNSQGYNRFGEKIVSQVETVNNIQELHYLLDSLVLNAEVSKQIGNVDRNLLYPQGNASDYICNYLDREFRL